jgi:hypothetical protein
VLVVVSVLYNRTIPAHSAVLDRLSALDKVRLAEVFHLRRALGDQVMPGWAEADIPVILYNEEFLFLVGLPDPQPGWLTVPGGARHGQDWEPVPGDDFFGQPYYRQKLLAPGQNTQAFTVQVGERWVASMATLDWMRISLAGQIRRDLPAALQPVAPYGLMVNLLVPGSDAYVTTVLHEAMHAYQGLRAADRLIAAEASMSAHSRQVPWEDPAFKAAWQVELDALNRALRAASPEESERLAREFLAQRVMRREAANLSADLIDLECAREWEEGIAKYGELSIYLLAFRSPDYQPLAELSSDPQFNQYRGAQRKWDQEIDQIRRMAGAEGDGRFYYTGFAQAVLLDRLGPGWKERLFTSRVCLEDLLAQAVKQP